MAQQRGKVFECLEGEASVTLFEVLDVPEDEQHGVLFENMTEEFLVLAHRSEIAQNEHLTGIDGWRMNWNCVSNVFTFYTLVGVRLEESAEVDGVFEFGHSV